MRRRLVRAGSISPSSRLGLRPSAAARGAGNEGPAALECDDVHPQRRRADGTTSARWRATTSPRLGEEEISRSGVAMSSARVCKTSAACRSGCSGMVRPPVAPLLARSARSILRDSPGEYLRNRGPTAGARRSHAVWHTQPGVMMTPSLVGTRSTMRGGAASFGTRVSSLGERTPGRRFPATVSRHKRAKALTRPRGMATLSPCDCFPRAQPSTMPPPPVEEMCMTKAELVDHVAAAVQLPKSQTDAVLTQLQATMDTLQAGEAVDLRGFGRFHLRHRQPRAGRNPRTGDTVQIPAKAVPIFTAGEAFQERVQSSAAPAGGACVRPADDVPVVPHREACTSAPRARAWYTASLGCTTGAPAPPPRAAQPAVAVAARRWGPWRQSAPSLQGRVSQVETTTSTVGLAEGHT